MRKSKLRKQEFGRTLAKAGDEATALTWNDYSTAEVPGTDTSNDGDKSSAFEKARLLARTNYWLRGFLQLRRYILNHGFTLEVAGAKKGKKMAEPTDKDIAALASFMAEEIQPNETFDETQVTTVLAEAINPNRGV